MPYPPHRLTTAEDIGEVLRLVDRARARAAEDRYAAGVWEALRWVLGAPAEDDLAALLPPAST